MRILTTTELKNHMETLYDKVRPVAEAEDIFKPLNLYFADQTPQKNIGEFCYSDKKHYYYGSIGDRGGETLEKMDSLFDLTYKIFKNRIFNIVLRYMGKYIAANGNVPDHRRIAFPKEVELLRLIGEEYAERREKDFEEILKEYPYSD